MTRFCEKYFTCTGTFKLKLRNYGVLKEVSMDCQIIKFQMCILFPIESRKKKKVKENI